MTEKKAKAALHRIWFHYYRLQSALNDAHNMDLIKYDQAQFSAQAPCHSMGMLRERIEMTTEKQIARIVQQEVRAGAW